MDRNTLNKYLGAVLMSLDDMEGWAPRSSVMLGMRVDLPTYEFVEGFLVEGKLATRTKEVLALTDTGRAMAKRAKTFQKKSAV